MGTIKRVNEIESFGNLTLVKGSCGSGKNLTMYGMYMMNVPKRKNSVFILTETRAQDFHDKIQCTCVEYNLNNDMTYKSLCKIIKDILITTNGYNNVIYIENWISSEKIDYRELDKFCEILDVQVILGVNLPRGNSNG